MSDSLWPHGLQHTRLPCPSLSSWICSNSWPLSQWHHPTISSSVIPFSSCPQSFPASGSSPMSWLFPSGGQLGFIPCQKISFFDNLEVDCPLPSCNNLVDGFINPPFIIWKWNKAFQNSHEFILQIISGHLHVHVWWLILGMGWDLDQNSQLESECKCGLDSRVVWWPQGRPFCVLA